MKIVNKIITCAIFVTVLLVVISCNSKNQQQVKLPNEYKVMEIGISDKTFTASYSASIKGKQDVEIRPQVSGLITEVRVREGENVRKGQILFVIDQVAFRATHETARANVEAAQANVETAKLTASSKAELYAQEIVSLYDLQTAQNSLKNAEAQLAQAQAQEVNAANELSYTIIRSPSDGVVGATPYRVGALVNSSIVTPLTTISDNSEMYVYFSMTENQILSLIRQYGSLDKTIESMPKVELKLGDGTTYDSRGSIEAISGVIDQTTGTVSVRAVFPNKNNVLLSGGVGSLIYPYEMKNVVVIPQEVTYELQDKVFVYKVDNGIAESSEIKVLAINDGNVYVVTSGLLQGDVIVAEGVGLLNNGTQITIVKE